MNEVLDEASRIEVDGRYVDMLRDWAEHGADSRYALAPEEVVERSRPRDRGQAEGQAHLELGAALWARGDQRGAERHWREAHRLDPMNFTAKRQAWSLAVPDAGDFARYWQGPLPGREDEWPYETRLAQRGPRLRRRELLPADRRGAPRPPVMTLDRLDRLDRLDIDGVIEVELDVHLLEPA